MQRANPIETRKCLEVVQYFKKANIRFVPIPVLDDKEFHKYMLISAKQIEKMEQQIALATTT